MKKITILSVLVFMLSIINTAFAQQIVDRKARIEAAKTAFLTEKMALTKEQAEKFWPVYNEYEQKRREAHKKAKVFKGENLEAMSDKEIRENIDEMHAMRQQELNIEKEYVDKFLKVISAKQLAIMYKSEREFMKMLLKRLDERRGEGPRGR